MTPVVASHTTVVSASTLPPPPIIPSTQVQEVKVSSQNLPQLFANLTPAQQLEILKSVGGENVTQQQTQVIT